MCKNNETFLKTFNYSVGQKVLLLVKVIESRVRVKKKNGFQVLQSSDVDLMNFWKIRISRLTYQF